MPSPYCQKRRSTWYLRVRVPADLAGVVGAQVIRSLGTGNAREARALAAAMAGRAPTWWAVLRRWAMAMILGKPIGEITLEDLTRDNLAALEDGFDRLDAEGRKALGMKLDALLRAGMAAVREGRADLRQAEIMVEAMRDSEHRGHARGLERAFALVGAQGAPASRDDASPAPAPPGPQARAKGDPRAAMRLEELATDARGYFAVNPVSEKTRASYVAAFEHFERIVGVKAVRNITEDDLLAFRAGMEGQKGRDGREKAATATVQKNLGHVKAVLRWAYMPPQRLIPADPGRDVQGPKKPKGATTDGVRLAFDEQELATIFRSPLFTGCARPRWTKPGPYLEREDRFYFFLAMFLAGARNTELPGAGIYDLGDIPCLDLRATARKTQAAPRVVPILPELARTGFLDWARKRIASGGKLFMGKQAIVKWTDFPSRYLRDIGVGDMVRTAYSLRHSHRQMLRGSGLSDELIDKTFGHEGLKVGAGYGKGIVTRQEAEAWLKAVRCPIDLSHLHVR